MEDLIIRNGSVIDGTGTPARRADVAIRGPVIAAVEPDYRGTARREIDAQGLVVAPGFIDVKTHSDFNLPLYPRAESRVHQGITTELIGSCGFTVAPIPSGRLSAVSEYLSGMAPAFSFRETSFEAYIEAFPATSVNVAMQVGHNTVRVAVMGLDRRAPTADEQAKMGRLVEEALDAGAVGVSSGPFTAPGSFADAEELQTLARLAGRRGARYATHLRDESDGVFDAMREAIAAAECTGVRTRIVHAKVSGTNNWGGAARMLDELADARARGIPIECDHYPYTTALVPLRNLLPTWVQEGGVSRALERLQDKKVRDDVRAYIAERGVNAFGHIPSWDAVLITMSHAVPEEIGKTVANVAARRSCDPVDALCDVLIADRFGTRGLVTSMQEDDIKAFVSCPWVLVGSDGRAFGPNGPLARELPHPRFYGTFPRILGHYCRDLELVSLPAAIHKMTGAAADAIGLLDRGTLRTGAAADITVFDAAMIEDKATFQEPRRYPTGIDHVIVNGVSVVDGGSHTGALPGRVLRRTRAGVA
jgi:N-acyl-D-amino-acid deacylase